MSLKPWREIAIPHEDVRKGNFQRAEFAADITRVHEGSATAEYQDPALFFERTFITEGMRLLLGSVVQRLTGQGGDPVIQLQTAFGGGKTHTMLAVMHLAGGKVAAESLHGVAPILAEAGVETVPVTRIVVLDGSSLAPNQPRQVDGHELRTLWGHLAWQLGGAKAYDRVKGADESGTSPGKETLAALIREAAPCVILIDELVAYIRQFEGSSKLAGGTYDSNLSFVQALTEAMKAVPNAVMLASLPESEREAGSEHGVAALHALEHYFGRVQAIWKPVAAGEAFEIVRRRLFSEIKDSDAVDATCRAFADMYVTQAEELPGETQENQYLKRMQSAYPIHPEVFERLYTDWSALPNFQRTRGVLKLLAQVIHRLWKDNNQDLLLMPGSIPLNDAAVRNDLVSYLPPGWDPVIEHDVDGERSEPVSIEGEEARFGSLHACRRVARSIFLGSAPTGVNNMARGLETERVILGCLQPEQALHVYRDALARLETRLTYLNKGHDRWWYDVKPNLRREMEDRRRRFDESEVTDAIKQAIRRVMGSGLISQVHVFAQSMDIPDDWHLRLVVLPPTQAWSRSGPNAARTTADEMLRMRGDQPRQKQNRLLFLAADADQVMHLKETVRALLAWQSIEEDIRDTRLNLDTLQVRQAKVQREKTQDTVFRLVRETYKCLLAPLQSFDKNGQLGKVDLEMYPLNPRVPGLSKEIDSVAAENELVIREWAPIHLHNLLKRWFWKENVSDVAALDVWQKTCQYLYFPRLAGSQVMQTAIAAGAVSRDFFGLAYGHDEAGGYRGLSFGSATSPLMDELLLIEPGRAAECMAALEDEKPAETEQPHADPQSSDDEPSQDRDDAASTEGDTAHKPARPTRFFGSVALDPVRASLEFTKVANEVLGLFTSNPGCKVRVKIDIEAVDDEGFEETIVRAARENAQTLGFDSSEFE